MEVSHTNLDFVLAKFDVGEFGDIEKGSQTVRFSNLRQAPLIMISLPVRDKASIGP
jgi:hypothetical protein